MYLDARFESRLRPVKARVTELFHEVRGGASGSGACPKFGYKFRTSEGIVASSEHDNLKIVQQKNLMAAHDKVNVPTTLKGASPTRSLRFAQSGEQLRGVGDIDQSNAVRDDHAAGSRANCRATETLKAER